MSVLPTALAFARRSIPTFPIWPPVEHHGKLVCGCRKGSNCPSPAKHPIAAFNGHKIAPNGHLDATTETGILKLWFGVQLPKANLGIRCKGLIVLDIDDRHGGQESLAKIEAEHGELPVTWRVQTGGGAHIFFRAPIGRSFASWRASSTPHLGKGVDGRCDDGFVVGVGSRHISGREYRWSVDCHLRFVELAPTPEWIIERISAKPQGRENGEDRPPRTPASEWQKLCCEIVRDYRDMAAAKLAGCLLRYHDPYAVMGLMEAWNAVRCDPPLDQGELTAIVHRIALKEARRLGGDEHG